MTDVKSHWETAYRSKLPDQLSWYAARADVSLELIESLGISHAASIVDVGGGASTLVDDLLARGYTDLTVLDISDVALEVSRTRLGAAAAKVRWLAEDLLRSDFDGRRFDLWHDRAVLHFLVNARDRARYREQLIDHLSLAGHAVLSVFADDGPTRCSGLDVQRYSEADLDVFLGPEFRRTTTRRWIHVTPAGVQQRFVSIIAARS